MRGLDYYTRTVFEWITDELGSQGTVCGGGRYDGLAQLFSPRPLAACGFAIGIERLLLLIQTVSQQDNPLWHFHPDVVIANERQDDGLKAQLLAERLRQQIDGLSVLVDCSGAKLKRQHQTALQSQCQAIVTLNSGGEIRLWDLVSSQQMTLNEKDLIGWLQQHLR